MQTRHTNCGLHAHARMCGLLLRLHKLHVSTYSTPEASLKVQDKPVSMLA